MGFFKLLHCRKDNAVCLNTVQKVFQMLSAGCMDRVLTQELAALGKLSVELVVKVVSIGQNYDGGAVQSFLEKVGIEDHRQRLAAALSMPEDAAFTVCFGAFLGGRNCFPNSKVLMVSCEDLEAL